jgi:uncharacterized protein (DUF1330 family)
MAAICVGTIRVKDSAAWEVLFRGHTDRCYAGEAANDAVVALKFADLSAANRWHDSPEYQALVPIREVAAEVTLVLYDC